MEYFKAISLSLIGTALSVCAQFSPQYIGTESPVINQLNEHIPNNCFIHVYKTLDGNIYPPDYFGLPDSFNVLIASSKIGAGVDPAIITSGMFSTSIPKVNSVSFFVRVFDRGFYCDSQTYRMTSKTLPINIEFDYLMSPVDDRDFDEDGLHNSWEQTYATDINVADTDGDGFTDNEEVCLNTDPNNSNDFLTVHGLETVTGNLLLTWDVRGGVEYIIQTSDGNLLSSNLIWQTIDVNNFGFLFITNKDPFVLYRVAVDCEE